ncbi:zinc finger with UFM1-specific peptidase domain protein-like isoform X2 [Trichogramma pretiosum]|uniref:zinc finger with UFM1-specific peptidase domain protein-like isoform X2 n=1 Tax=Trichogramma pretiosum TaxID=7493 RepID=UPI0006C9E40C|nr:zinc finger with UFM1-specific peptidase domain protein-like isoform X2 [Trichogramma pretiosum]
MYRKAASNVEDDADAEEACSAGDAAAAANKIPIEMSYSCEICGRDGFDDAEMRSHMALHHLKGAANCPFCDLGEISPAEMLLHVNSAHLDYLTPSTPESLAFIDDDGLLLVGDGELTDGLITKNGPRDKSTSVTSKNSPITYAASVSKTSSNTLIKKGENKSKITGSLLNNNNNNSAMINNEPVNTAGHGSPLRSSLNLQLRSPATPKLPAQECPMCPYSSDSPEKLQEHVNRQHFDLISPSITPGSPETHNSTFNCPFCVTSFSNSSDLELHVNFEHKDILSPAKGSSEAAKSAVETPSCPVCLSTAFKNSIELQSHIEEHFSKKPSPSPLITPDASADRQLARDMERREKEVRRLREQREFAMLQAQYALVPKIKLLSSSCGNVMNTYMCTAVDHYAVSYGDKGWGCGYRNLQMMFSSLLQHTGYNELLYRAWSSQADGSSSSENPPRSSIPSISKIQKMIEWAWAQGFDIQGAEQLGGKLVNTRKWIGATEVVTLLSSLRIKCQLMDFHRPTSPNGSHPEMFKWLLNYFQKEEDFKPPLYLQHQGHSRTVIGVEQLRNGTIFALVLDPSHSKSQMAPFNNTGTANSAMRLVRTSIAAMKAKQYQIVAVVGTMDTEMEYQQSKVLRSQRIPHDR